MKLRTVLSIFLFFTFSASAAETMALGISTSLKSQILDEDRPFMVYLPPSYHSSDRTFPVIYLLDGDIHRFRGFTGVLEALSTETLESQVQEAIVVAIPNTNRSRDLTPTKLDKWTFQERVLDTFEESGEADNFFKFLETELLPTIKTSYRTSNRNMLVGESFGGLFAAHVLLSSSSTFTDYLIIDPTALWDNDYLNRSYKINAKQASSANIYFAFANNSHLGDIGLTNYKWGNNFAKHIISKAKSHSTLKYYEKETHGTVAFMAWYDGLKFLLSSGNELTTN